MSSPLHEASIRVRSHAPESVEIQPFVRADSRTAIMNDEKVDGKPEGSQPLKSSGAPPKNTVSTSNKGADSSEWGDKQGNGGARGSGPGKKNTTVIATVHRDSALHYDRNRAQRNGQSWNQANSRGDRQVSNVNRGWSSNRSRGNRFQPYSAPRYMHNNITYNYYGSPPPQPPHD